MGPLEIGLIIISLFGIALGLIFSTGNNSVEATREKIRQSQIARKQAKDAA